MRTALLTVLILLGVFLIIRYAADDIGDHRATTDRTAAETVDPETADVETAILPRAQADTATVVYNDTRWTLLCDWNFTDGFYPESWGWGDIHIRDGYLWMRDSVGTSTVYMMPLFHEEDYYLETEVQLIAREDDHDIAAHLITRDSYKLDHETGMAIYGDAQSIYLRHRINRAEREGGLFSSGVTATYGDWHHLQLTAHGDWISAAIDGCEPVRIPRHRGGLYNEPHVTVVDGTARFKYFRMYSPAGTQLPGSDRTMHWAASRCVSREDGPAEDAVLPPEGAGGGTWPGPEPERSLLVRILLIIFYVVIGLVTLYLIRHYRFTLNRTFGRQRHPYLDVDTADWPQVTILVPAHNEEGVITEILTALLNSDYPHERLTIIPINDRSQDRTAEIIDDYALHHPTMIRPFHRHDGPAGKAAALKDAMAVVNDDIILVFDADYIPGSSVVKQLVAPFFDPEVGAVMGRVIPHNVEENLLTRLLDLERSGGYQVDQQARMNLHVTPQYGGTVGGIRKAALESVGGWRIDTLAEDTDATFRLLLGGWKTVYQNRTECYEQVPTSWPDRIRQVKRWARGHNQTMWRYCWSLLGNHRTSLAEKIDGVMLLHIYMIAPILLLGWGVGIVLWYLGVNKPGLIVILAVTAYSTLGNFAIFFEVATAAYLDGTRGRIRIMPFLLLGFLVNLMSVAWATLSQPFAHANGKEVRWERTNHNNGNGTRLWL